MCQYLQPIVQAHVKHSPESLSKYTLVTKMKQSEFFLSEIHSHLDGASEILQPRADRFHISLGWWRVDIRGSESLKNISLSGSEAR